MTNLRLRNLLAAGGARRACGRARRLLRRQLPQQREGRRRPREGHGRLARHPGGHQGLEVAGGGYLKTEMVPAAPSCRARSSRAAPLTSQVVAERDLQGRADHAPPVRAGRAGRHLRQVLRQASERSPCSASRSSCSPARCPMATVSTSSRPRVTAQASPARRPGRAAEPPRAQGARRGDRSSVAGNEKHQRDARHDRQPGPDDGLGDEHEHLVPRAAADGGSAKQRARRSRRCSRSSPADSPRASHRADRRQRSRRRRWAVTAHHQPPRPAERACRATSVAATLEQDPAIDLVRADAAGAGSPRSADVALHVVETSSAPNIAEEVARVRELSTPRSSSPPTASRTASSRPVSRSARATSSCFRSRPRPSCSRSARPRWAPRPPRHGKVVTVFSPKGGSGKTVVATNLAVAAARSGLRTRARRPGPPVRRLRAHDGRRAARDHRRPRNGGRRRGRREAARVRQHGPAHGARHPPGAEAARRG